MNNSQKGLGLGKFKNMISQIPGGILKKVFLLGVPALAAILVIAVVATSILVNPNQKEAAFGKVEKQQKVDIREKIDPVEKAEVKAVKKDLANINRDIASISLEDVIKNSEGSSLKDEKTLSVSEIQANPEENEKEISIETQPTVKEEAPEIKKPNAAQQAVDVKPAEETPTVDESPEVVEEPSEPEAPAEDDEVETWVDKYVNTDILNLRSNYSFDGDIIGTLTKGQIITEISVINNSEWSKVQLADGTSGYVYNYYLTTEYVEESKPEEEAPAVEDSSFEEMSGTLYIGVGAANVRSEASASSNLVTTLYYGNSVTITGFGEGWYKVIDSSGNGGFIREDLLRDTPVPQEELDALNEVAEETQAEEAPTPVEEPAPAPPAPAPVAPGNSGGVAAVNIALAQVGKPYIYGTAGPNSFDCSGLVQYAVRNAGGSISRSSYTQARDGIAVPFSSGDYSQLAPGDVLCFAFGGGVSHTGMYIGNGEFVHAMNPSDGIQVNSLYGYWSGSLAYVRRVFY